MIVGKKIKLVPFEPNHWAYICNWMSDPYYKYYFRNIPELLNVAQMQQYPQVMGMQVFMIVSDTNEVIGMATWDNVRILPRTCHIGFIIDKNFQGKGYTKEAFMEFCYYLTNRLGIHKLTAKIAECEEDTISKAMYGAFKDKNVIRDEYFMDGKWHNEIWISVLDHEFAKLYEIFKAGKLKR